ncbi:hypothetical protein RJ639_032939, partial [Escallonia herrerae]
MFRETLAALCCSLGNGLNENGVQNVTHTNSVFTKTDNGVRIKSRARASNNYATNINFRNLIMRNIANPILIDQTYCPSNQCPHQSVTYVHIRGTSRTEAAVRFDCSSSNPCRDQIAGHNTFHSLQSNSGNLYVTMLVGIVVALSSQEVVWGGRRNKLTRELN